MGFFDGMKQAMDSAKDGFAKAKTQVGELKASYDQTVAESEQARGATALASLVILNPTDQAQVDLINAGTGNGLGVVVGNQNNLESGDSVFRTNAQVAVRMRLADGELGTASWHKVWTSSKVIRSLVYGLEIPVEVDRTTSMVTSVDPKLVEATLKAAKKK